MINEKTRQELEEAGAIANKEFQTFLEDKFGHDRAIVVRLTMSPIAMVLMSMAEIGLDPIEAVEAAEEMLKFIRKGAELAESI